MIVCDNDLEINIVLVRLLTNLIIKVGTEKNNQSKCYDTIQF